MTEIQNRTDLERAVADHYRQGWTPQTIAEWLVSEEHCFNLRGAMAFVDGVVGELWARALPDPVGLR